MRKNPYALILAVIFVLMVIAFIVSLNFGYTQAKIGPAASSGIIAILAGVQLIREIRNPEKMAKDYSNDDDEGPRQPATFRKYVMESLWMLGFLAAIWVAGFLIALPFYSLAYMKTHGTKWKNGIIVAALLLIFVYGVFQLGLGVELYKGLILTALGS